MKDLKNMFFYVGGTLVVMGTLISLAMYDVVSGNVVGWLAILLVIVLPVIISIKAVGRERNQGDQS